MFELDLTRVDYTWQPAGESQSNTFTAQQIFKAPDTTTAGAVFQATGTISAIPTMDANAIAMFQGTEGTTGYVFFSSAASNSHFVFRRRQGTYATPTAVQSGNILGAIQWQGYGASTFGTTASAEIRGLARQNFTESARGSALEFYATANGSTSLTQLFVIEPTIVYSLVTLQGSGTVRVSATSGNTRTFSLSTSTANRWTLIANSTAEGGTADGSNFEIRRYNNSGTDLGLIMAATRSTGNITFNGGGGTTTFSANKINISTAQSPASNGTGTTGDVAWDTSYLYICTATDTWKRVALTGGY
jgi:hypothetical protein